MNHNFKIKLITNYTRKSSKTKIDNVLNDIFKTKDFNSLVPKLKEFFSKSFGIYLSSILTKDILKEKKDILGVTEITEQDTDMLNNILGSDLLWKSYSNVGEEATKLVNTILGRGIRDKLPNAEIKKEILSNLKTLTKHRAETIIRTERNNVQNLAREKIYMELDPNGLYYMAGPDDHRTAETTKEVKKRIGKGKTINEVKEIIKKYGDQKTYRSDRPFVIHINTRHRLQRVVK